MIRYFLLASFTALAACSAPDRVAMIAQPSTLELRPLVSSAMVRTVSLPSYAAAEEVSRETAAGLITSNEDILWADAPDRAVTLVIVESLADILNTDVGPEPWPFLGLPDVSIDVRVTRMIAAADGAFHLSGQYYVGGDGISYRNTAESFAFRVPMPDQSISSIATSQAAALRSLSEQIAGELGR